MALPNTYRAVEYIETSGTQYIDTGIAPSDYLVSLKIEADMSYVTKPTGSSTQSYLFGTGHYTSTAGNRRNVLAGYRGASSTTLFSFLNDGQLSNAVTFTGATLDTNRHLFVIDQPNGQYGFDGATQSFGSTDQSTNTTTILIFCSRMSGASGQPIGYYSTSRLYSFKMYDNGTLIRDFMPCKNDNDEVGLYDLVNGVFYSNAGTGSFTAGPDLYTITADASPSGYGTVTGGGYYASGTSVTLTATASNNRYSFTEWTDGETANPRTITVSEDAEYIAQFVKNKVIIGNEYRLYIRRRTSSTATSIFFSNILSADINEDLMQKATSTIVCEKPVSIAVNESDVVTIRDGKGNQVYIGVVQSVEGRTIVASQMQSFFNFNLYAMIDDANDKAYYTPYTVLDVVWRYLFDIILGRFDTRVTNSSGTPAHGYDILQYNMNAWLRLHAYGVSDPSVYPYRTKSETINGESYLYSMYSLNEVAIYTQWNSQGELEVNICQPRLFTSRYQTINVGNNEEFIRDIEVTQEQEDVNVLIIFNSSGTTLRGVYYVSTNGTYGTTDGDGNIPNTLRYRPPKSKIITSDDTLTEVRDAELNKIQYNHKISFTFDLKNNFYDFGDLMLGQNINFYVGDRLYNSVLTGWSFHLENGRMLDSVRMVCGKVRNNLTSKLNMGKVK